jgi:membrane-bound serine protease (ClpP class)
MEWLLVIGLIVLGFLLILIEIFLIPGFNIFGLGGGLALVAGVYYAYVKLGIWYALGTFGISVLLGLIILRLGLKTKTWHRFILTTSEDNKEGFRAPRKELEDLVGLKGTAITMLRPSGTALIEDRKIDVVTEGSFVPKDSAIEVVQVEGYRVVVRPV